MEKSDQKIDLFSKNRKKAVAARPTQKSAVKNDGPKMAHFWAIFGQKTRLSTTFAKKPGFLVTELITKKKKTQKGTRDGVFGQKHVKNVLKTQKPRLSDEFGIRRTLKSRDFWSKVIPVRGVRVPKGSWEARCRRCLTVAAPFGPEGAKGACRSAFCAAKQCLSCPIRRIGLVQLTRVFELVALFDPVDHYPQDSGRPGSPKGPLWGPFGTPDHKRVLQSGTKDPHFFEEKVEVWPEVPDFDPKTGPVSVSRRP